MCYAQMMMCSAILFTEVSHKCPHTYKYIYFWCCSKNHTCRIEYDAYRTDLEELNLGPRDANTLPKIEQSQQQFQIHREKYERMRNDVSIKLKFLEENKVCDSSL